MPKLNETKTKEMQEIVPEFWETRKHFMLSKTFKVLTKRTVDGKKYFAKLFVLNHGASTWFSPTYQVSFAKLSSSQIRHFTNSPFVTFNCSISEILQEIFFVFFRKISDLSKNME